MSDKSQSGRIAQEFVKFAETQNLKGKARDRAAFYFMVGAANALESDGGVTALAFMVGLLGFVEVEAAARGETGAQS